FLQVLINAQVDDLSSHNTKYTSPALIQKVFANMRRNGKGFLGVKTPLFDNMLVQQQVHYNADVEEDEDDNEHKGLNPQMTLLWMNRRHPNRGKIIELDADEDVTLVNVDADTQGRMEEDVTAVKDINVVESKPTVFDDEEDINVVESKPTFFDDEEVTMSMAYTLIKIKAEKARILDEQMAKGYKMRK
nr:hypothetical protein [Tanacetum cinerariifolium]